MTHRRLTTDGTHTSEEGARRNAAVIADCVRQIYNPRHSLDSLQLK